MSKFPVWVGGVDTKRSGSKWRVTVYSNTFGLLNSPERQQHYVDGSLSQDQAETLAINKSNKVRLYSNGCWLVAKAKEKYGPAEDRKDLFTSFMHNLRRKYDGINPVYQSAEAQAEIQSALKLPSMTFLESFSDTLFSPLA